MAGDGGGGGQKPAPPALRAPLIMLALGVVILLAGLLAGDERYRALAFVVGGLMAAVAAVTILWNRIEQRVRG